MIGKMAAAFFSPIFKKKAGENPVMGNLNQTPVSPLFGGRFGRFDFRTFSLTGLDPTQPYEYEFRLL